MDQKIEKIINQAKMWAIYGRLIPFVSMLSALALYLITSSVSIIIFYLSWIVFIITCLIWWFWVIKSLVEISQMFCNVVKIVNEIHSELIDVRNNVKSLENSSND